MERIGVIVKVYLGEVIVALIRMSARIMVNNNNSNAFFSNKIQLFVNWRKNKPKRGTRSQEQVRKDRAEQIKSQNKIEHKRTIIKQSGSDRFNSARLFIKRKFCCSCIFFLLDLWKRAMEEL